MNTKLLDYSQQSVTEEDLPKIWDKLRKGKYIALDLSYNQVPINSIRVPSDLPELQYLYLYKNQTKEIILEGDLPNLSILHMGENQLESFRLPAGFSKLEHLRIDKNQLKKLEFDAPDQLHDMRSLFLKENQIENIPKEFWDSSENCWQEVNTYLSSILEAEKTYYLHQAKMILIGNGEVGKSSIKIKLLDKKGVLPKKEDRTEGLDMAIYSIKDLPTNITGLDGLIDFDLSIWDFGGQGKYREIQQLFCGRKALYLFVTSIDDSPTKEEYIGFEYWLSMANAFGFDHQDKTQSPVIHVLNKIDLPEYEGGAGVNYTPKERKELFSQIKYFARISCQKLTNFDSFETSIKNVLPQISKDIFSNRFDEKWFKVKDKLKEESKSSYHITLETYNNICNDNGLKPDKAQLWLNYLDRIGDLIYFGNHPDLKEWVILNPLWVKKAIYKVIDDKDFIENGKLRSNHLKYIWPDKNGKIGYTEEERKNLLALMLTYKLCYLQKGVGDEQVYIVPAKFSDKSPVFPETVSSFEFELSFYYSPYIPAGTINKFIVDFHESIYQGIMWKNSCLVHTVEDNLMSYALVEEKWEEGKVDVKIGGHNPRAIYKLVHDGLKQLNEEVKKTKFMDNLSFEIKVKMKDKEYTLSDIQNFGKESDYWFLFGDQNDPNKNITINSLTQPKKTEVSMKYIKIFLASSSELKEEREKLGNFIGVQNNRLVKKGVFIELIQWEHFLDAMSSTRLQDEYNKAIRECDVFLSLFFTKVGKYSKEEFYVARSQFLKTGKPLVYTYFKEADINTSSAIKKDLMSLWDFQEELDKMGHFYTSYNDVNDLFVKFRGQFDRWIDDGKV